MAFVRAVGDEKSAPAQISQKSRDKFLGNTGIGLPWAVEQRQQPQILDADIAPAERIFKHISPRIAVQY
ncbi:Uncharacterised protein [Mycobacteroides abscessus subsp. abscessus]|nr:Uncharacterised protein [Mycobacteroides abscessus subsp. abscessus]